MFNLDIIYITLINLVKYLIFGLILPFNFMFYQTVEFFAFNFGLFNYFESDKLSNIVTWSLYGILPSDTNLTLTNNTTVINWLNNSDMTFYLIIFASSLIIIPTLGLIKSLILYFYKKKFEYNFKKIIIKLFFISYLPITTLVVKNLILLQTNSFELSMITITILSLIVIGFPALIYYFIFGKKKRYWRRKFYFLIEPFAVYYKYLSVLFILRKISISVLINLFKTYPLIINSIYLTFNFISTILYIKYKPFDNIYIRNQVIINMGVEILTLLLNYILILYRDRSRQCVYIIIGLQIICLILNIFFLYKIRLNNSNHETLEYVENIQMSQIISETTENEVVKCSIPFWAEQEFFSSIDEADDINANNNINAINNINAHNYINVSSNSINIGNNYEDDIVI